ncbi:potassium-transporting ATPase subunit KdpC [Burkholderia multivorans]|uniref:potassium-transporting ATPase subunit KdpC n=1 Tax=Burkholderia multivorans TaxID=87883 RepID=UPI000CFE795B|nr:potassium-transporting ATPase subunit KdpC [Burkholderia multivorans]MBR7894299.1 potassium-transporting ATPase subunit KdpC [Burkholderia multivorans]MBR8454021.1 potassium-transporting ATPase subunit KdpC [Burkholderia multivorans]MBU9449976.1 potassium-transporting ATPase subunit KdpC [Burkholderia multivorans]MCL4647847.1 potassium-transporting ATPase subunit KdpC [Burkholderia multivorans]PRG38195.1 potassium-transporting ATPase subunit C [Burkholderia multivorans]
MKSLIRPLVVIFVVLTAVTGLAYPAVLTAFGQAVFPWQANGSLIERNGQVVGSALIGQQFDAPKYFWGRLSATSPMPYNAAGSGGSNLGPLNPSLAEQVKARIAALRDAGTDLSKPVPVDLVTASASGVDPEITPAAAAYQIERVANARRLSRETVAQLVVANTTARQVGVLGEPRVNVLKLNLALDAAQAAH